MSGLKVEGAHPQPGGMRMDVDIGKCKRGWRGDDADQMASDEGTMFRLDRRVTEAVLVREVWAWK
jgi:hypothetical protein